LYGRLADAQIRASAARPYPAFRGIFYEIINYALLTRFDKTLPRPIEIADRQNNRSEGMPPSPPAKRSPPSPCQKPVADIFLGLFCQIGLKANLLEGKRSQ